MRSRLAINVNSVLTETWGGVYKVSVNLKGEFCVWNSNGSRNILTSKQVNRISMKLNVM